MAGLNSNSVHKLYMSVIEDVINNVRELDDGPDEHVLKELKALWENKLIQSKAVEFHTETPVWETKQPRAMEGFHTERLPPWDNKHLMPPKGGFLNTEMEAAQQDMRRFQQNQHIVQPVAAARAQQGLLLPPQQQAPHLWRYMPPHPQLINNQGQFVQMMRGPNGGFYVQPILLQRPMQPGGMQAPGIQQQVLSPLQGGLPQQPRVMIQPQPYVLATTMTPQPGPTAASWARQVQQAPGSAPQASGQTAAAWAHGAAAAPQASGQTAAAWAHGAAAGPQASGQTAAAWAHGGAAAPHVSGQTAAAWAHGATTAPQASGTTAWFQVQQSHVAPASQASGLSTADWVQQWAKGTASPQAPRQPQAQHPQPQQPPMLLQVDGTGDTSSSEEDDEEEDVKYEEEEENKDGQTDEEPLNSGDDESGDEGGEDEFDADCVVVCQYEKKVTRVKNRWKLQLKDGIMNLNGRDYIFSKAIGEAEW